MITSSYRSVQFVISVILKKGNLKMHIVTVHDNKKSFKCSICNFSFSQKASLKIWNQFIRTKSHISAQFVIMFVIQNVIWKSILNQFMITWTHPSAQFVITIVQERELWKYNHTNITRFLKILILTSWRILEVSVFSTFLK